MRVVMFGYQTRGHRTLRALLDSGHDVVTVAAARLRGLLAADPGTCRGRAGSGRHGAHDGRGAGRRRHRRPAGGGGGADGHRHRPLPPDGGPDRARHGRGARPDRLRTGRVHAAGPVEGDLLHERAEEDTRIDRDWCAEELERLVRARSAPCPAAFTHHRRQRLEALSAVVSQDRYGGTPGRAFLREGDGAVIVAGADACSGRNHGPAITRVRTADGHEPPAADYFTSMGGCLTRHL